MSDQTYSRSGIFDEDRSFLLPGADEAIILNREDYFRQKAIDLQNSIVNVKSATSLTSEAFVWTYRTTNCDVISIITTAIPIRDGYMKDINIESHEPKRLKPPNVKKTVKDILGSTPYEFGLSIDVEKKKKKLNKMLQDEKKEFMNKLSLTRFIRSKIEEKSVLKIQSVYRGYYIRNNFDEIHHYCEIHKMIRSNIRSYLNSESYTSNTIFEYRLKRQQLRQYAAKLIQSSFKRYLSRQCYRRRKFQKLLAIRTRSSIIIQSLLRGVIARAKVRSLVEKRRTTRKLASVIKIQAMIRRLFAKRRVVNRRFKLHVLAARMIQSWYRAKYSRRMGRHIKQMLYLKRANRAATLFQKIVRSFLDKRRVNRLRFRKVWMIVTRATIKIQSLIRKFLGKITVQRKRQSLEKIRLEKATKEQQENDRQRQIKEAEENQLLLDSADLFIQARKGNTVNVEDIYLGLVGGEEHTSAETDDLSQDTIFTISARIGNMDLLRKCLVNWSFDLNHRNQDGMTAVMLAAKHHHILALQYLLSFHPNHPNYLENDVAVDKSLQLELSSDDIGFLFIQATVFACASNPIDLSMMQHLLLLNLDINSASALVQGNTAVHTACELGNNEMFKYLHLKQKAKIVEIKNELNQLPLHCAVTSSVTIVKWILGLDPNYQSYMSPETRMENLTSLDIDGKDCLLLSVLAGKTDIVHLIEQLLASQGADPTSASEAGIGTSSKGGGFKKASGSSSVEEVAWSNADIIKAGDLIEKNNIYCLHKLISGYGFDVNWAEENSNRSLPMIACAVGDVDMIELLLSKSADFSLVDSNQETAFHYAVRPHPKYPLTTSSSISLYKKKESILPLLLSHQFKSKCKISASLLTKQTLDTMENCFHIAARHGLELNIDLLIDPAVTHACMMAVNNEGMTPFMIACFYYREKILHNYLRMGSNIRHEDNQGNSCFWYIFHPHPVAVLANRRVYGSEYTLQVATSISRKERDEEMNRIQNEIQLITLFLRNGCHLYTKLKTVEDHQNNVTPEKLKETLAPRPSAHSNDGNANYDKFYDQLEPGDIILYEYSYTLLKVILPNLISPLDAWRLLLASIRIDDGNSKTLIYLLRCGIFDVICNDHLISSVHANLSVEALNHAYSSDESLANPAVVSAVQNNNHNSLSIDTSSNLLQHSFSAPTPSAAAAAANRNKSHRQQSLDKHIHRTGSNSGPNTQNLLNNASTANLTQVTITIEHIRKLHDLYYNSMTLIAWIVRFQQVKVFTYFLKKFSVYYNYMSPVDRYQLYPLLHFIAIHGNAEIMDALLSTIHTINASVDSVTSGNSSANVASIDSDLMQLSAAERDSHMIKRIFIRYENYNRKHETPFMLASKHQNFSIIKKFYQLKVNLRNALHGRWNGWVYAFVKRLEQKEKLTQTGRYGRDDELYFNPQHIKEIKDFPEWAFWYE